MRKGKKVSEEEVPAVEEIPVPTLTDVVDEELERWLREGSIDQRRYAEILAKRAKE